jgi:putative ABC transport system permease protein
VLGRGDSDATALLPQTFDQLRRDTSITVASPSQQVNTLFTIVSNIDEIFIGMAAVVMVASGIAIMLALYNSMEQRRRQIAVLRVLGSSRARIFGLIVTESAIIGLLGAALGIVLALVGNQIVASIMKQRLNLVIDTRIPLIALLAVIVATILIASLAGIIPAVMAYRTPVARNLRPLG